MIVPAGSPQPQRVTCPYLVRISRTVSTCQNGELSRAGRGQSKPGRRRRRWQGKPGSRLRRWKGKPRRRWQGEPGQCQCRRQRRCHHQSAEKGSHFRPSPMRRFLDGHRGVRDAPSGACTAVCATVSLAHRALTVHPRLRKRQKFGAAAQSARSRDHSMCPPPARHHRR